MLTRRRQGVCDTFSYTFLALVHKCRSSCGQLAKALLDDSREHAGPPAGWSAPGTTTSCGPADRKICGPTDLCTRAHVLARPALARTVAGVPAWWRCEAPPAGPRPSPGAPAPWHRGSAARQYLCHGQSRTTTRSRPATATPAPETVVFVTTDSPSPGQDLRHELRLAGDGPQPRRHFCHGRSRTRRVVRVSVPPQLDSGALPDDGAVPHRAGRPAHRLVTRSVGPLRHPDTRWGASSCCRPQAPRPYRPALPARRRPRR